MDSKELDKKFSEHKAEIAQRFIIDDVELRTVKAEMEGTHKIKATEKQWTTRLNKHGIFKYVHENEAIRICVKQQRVQQLGGGHGFLVTANGVLLRIRDMENHCRRKRIHIPDGNVDDNELPQPVRELLFVDLPFNFRQLEDPQVFATFRRMLWLTNVHFNKNFDNEDWAPDKDGLYNRSDADILDLTRLSELHNMIYRAIKQFREGKSADGWVLVRCAFAPLNQIVRAKHHRQFSDILGIIRMLQRDDPKGVLKGVQSIQSELCNQLHDLAVEVLKSDPRTAFFEALKQLPEDGLEDPQGHMMQAFDAFCRDLWSTKVPSDDMKAYYSYNQSSFPRADRGRFYEKFEGKSCEDILSVLRNVDDNLGRHSIPTFCLWHTALHYLMEEGRFADAESVSFELSKRRHEVDEASYSRGQLNLGVAKTHYLLGRAQEEQGKLSKALVDFELSSNLRRLAVPVGQWDALLTSTLRSMIFVGTKLGEYIRVEDWKQQQNAISCRLEQIDRANRGLRTGQLETGMGGTNSGCYL